MKSILILALSAFVVLGCSDNKQAGTTTARLLGAGSSVGKGTVSSYAEFAKDGAPKAIGIVFPGSALDGLPHALSDGHHCYDRNKDGKIDPQSECAGSHEWVIPLPSDAARRSDVPFKWVGLNWNPHGHIPPKVYDIPHFDVHFHMEPIENVFAVTSGDCGPEFVRCDQFKIATRPLPSNYMPPDYQNVDAVAPAMGNHLIDPTSPEFKGKTFTRTFIFGTYEGRLTFYEEMVTRDFLLKKGSECFPIKAPPAVAVKGYYPTQSCIRYQSPANEFTISLEGFALREASAPAPVK